MVNFQKRCRVMLHSLGSPIQNNFYRERYRKTQHNPASLHRRRLGQLPKGAVSARGKACSLQNCVQLQTSACCNRWLASTPLLWKCRRCAPRASPAPKTFSANDSGFSTRNHTQRKNQRKNRLLHGVAILRTRKRTRILAV